MVADTKQERQKAEKAEKLAKEKAEKAEKERKEKEAKAEKERKEKEAKEAAKKAAAEEKAKAKAAKAAALLKALPTGVRKALPQEGSTVTGVIYEIETQRAQPSLEIIAEGERQALDGLASFVQSQVAEEESTK